MNTSKTRNLDPMQFVKLLAFRAGYEDAREGRPFDYERWETRHLSVYETGRLTATYLRARGDDLRPIPRKGRFAGTDLGWLSGALIVAHKVGALQ